MSYLDHFSAERAGAIYAGVLKLLRSKRIFRQQGITARQIAEMMGEDARSISAAIALQSGETFLALLARIRVREACRLLRSSQHAEMPVENVGLKAGFSSRQAFHSAFNRIVGMTPLQYRSQSLSEEPLPLPAPPSPPVLVFKRTRCRKA